MVECTFGTKCWDKGVGCHSKFYTPFRGERQVTQYFMTKMQFKKIKLRSL